MKNYWLKKEATRKFDERIKNLQEERARTLKEVMMWLLPKVEQIKKVSWDTPILQEMPQENRMYQKQVYFCPMTGVKHNFKMQEEENLEAWGNKRGIAVTATSRHIIELVDHDTSK